MEPRRDRDEARDRGARRGHCDAGHACRISRPGDHGAARHLEALRIELRMTVDMLSSYNERLVKEVELDERSGGGVSRTPRPRFRAPGDGRCTLGSIVHARRSICDRRGERRCLPPQDRRDRHDLRARRQQFVRVTTSLRDAKGARAVGTVLAKDSPAMAAAGAACPSAGRSPDGTRVHDPLRSAAIVRRQGGRRALRRTGFQSRAG